MRHLYQIALTKMKGIGPVLSRHLLEHCGSIEAIFQSSRADLLAIPQIGKQITQIIQDPQYLLAAERELKYIQDNQVNIYWFEDENYPYRLQQCHDAPLLLYAKGEAALNPKHVVSIVGTRNATPYGARICQELIASLCDLDIQIISGLAYGIDIMAHREALKNGISTIAVLAHGLDRIYPYGHYHIAEQMMHQGALLTEFPWGKAPERAHFPMRNRIIAGLADVVIVIEAAQNGGALITTELANSYQREVCAFPGAIDQTFSAGCNFLIKSHRAQLIRNGADLLHLMNWGSIQQQGAKQLQLLPPNLTSDQQKLYQTLSKDRKTSIDELSRQTLWSQNKLAIILLELEILDLIYVYPGKTYKLI